MTMQIGDKLKEVRAAAAADPNLANQIAVAGRDAIIAGMKQANGQVTPQWESLMRFFTNDATELARLCGQDTAFNQSQWGLYCLAYIAGDSTCTSETPGSTGTRRTMAALDELANRGMLETLDREEEQPGEE